MTRGIVTITTHPSHCLYQAEQSNKAIVAVGLLHAGSIPSSLVVGLTVGPSGSIKRPT